jgi:thiamine kinase-like enzyme
MQDRPVEYRQLHQLEVQFFLREHFPSQAWEFSLPKGTGSETYFAQNNERSCFIKLGAQADRYQTLASLGLTPEVLAAGLLDDGTSILVQPFVAARTPTRRDYQIHLEQFATAIARVHSNPSIKKVLPRASSELYRELGLEALARIRQKWSRYQAQVPQTAGFIEESLELLGQQVQDFQGAGLVASHNDICNANWLIDPDGHLYLIDLDSMQWDDPAVDIGATLWWYYPPELRQKFLTIVGHADDRAFENRMRVRMTLHCLNICLPRENSFDQFDPAAFSGRLADFRACLASEENPQGYADVSQNK